MEPTSSKLRVSEVSADRLGSLPDELLRHILTLMPMHDAVGTTISSKRWDGMSYSLPSLIFQYNTFPDVERKVDCFVQFVDHVISRYEGSSIKTFDVSFSPKNGSDAQVKNAWITFAIEKNVEQLCLSLHKTPQCLPSCIFASRSLKKLHLELYNHSLKLPASVDLPNLKELYLLFLILDNDDLKKFFSGSPVLEVVELESCDLLGQTLAVSGLKLNDFKLICCYLQSLKNIAVSAQVLKCLDIYQCYDLRGCHIDIQTPNLERFIFGSNMPQSFSFGDMSSVSCASFCPPNPYGWSRNSQCALRLIQGVPNMTCAVLNEWFIEELFRGGYLFFRHLNATSLHCLKDAWLHIWTSKQHVQKTVVALLTKLPNLWRLRISISDAEQPKDMSDLERNIQELGDLEVLNHLEYAEILNFKFRPSDVEVVEFLLGNAKVLVEVKVRAPGRTVETRKMTSAKAKMLACRKASSKAKILFSV